MSISSNQTVQLAKQRQVASLISALKQDQLEFLVRFANRLSQNVSELPSYDQYEKREAVNTTQRGYVDMHLRWFVDLGELLELRRRFSSGSQNKRLPNVDHFAEKVLADNVRFNHPTDNIRMNRVSAIRDALADVLGLRNKKSIQRLRDEVIRACYARGLSHKQIAKELDAHSDLQNDPLLDTWHRGFLPQYPMSWLNALTDSQRPALVTRVKSLFSKAGRKKG